MKKFRIVLLVFLLVIVGIVGTVGYLFKNQYSAAKSIVQIEDGLWYLEFAGDDGIDKLVARGGVANADEIAPFFVDHFFYGLINQGPADDRETDVACSFISSASADGKGWMMGRNYDWRTDAQSMIVHNKPCSGNYESYSTVMLAFVFGPDYKPETMSDKFAALASLYVPLDGINEKGLGVAVLEVGGDSIPTHQTGKKVDMTTTVSVRYLLDKAANVDEAIALLREVNMHSDIGHVFHLAVADAQGKSVVVEYVDGKMNVKDTHFLTNHSLTKEPNALWLESSISRFNKLDSCYQATDGTMSADEVKHALMSVQQDNTLWSIVYDLSHFSFDLYYNRNFEKSAYQPL